ncbi:hypothetical protein [Anaerocolumna sp.]|uniref:hypothetical protein n=1 Tax=Anaerocolumna sp. TaxID=2041569 RepID=UPI0028A9C1C1|nr:hypothetical protein [Anaerocolumna sp.]
MKKGKKRRKSGMFVIMTAILLCIAIVVIIVFPPSSGKMSSFLDENGNQIEGSISEKIHVDINGTSLGMFVTAKDRTKPVLLVLGGAREFRNIFWNKCIRLT